MKRLKTVVDAYMKKVPQVKEYCVRCLATQRWGGSVVLMLVDAAFTSIGLNYFTAVVPKVQEFEKTLVKTGKIKSLEKLANADLKELKKVWKNERSWHVAKKIAAYLAALKKEKGLSERGAFIHWAKNSKLNNWKENPVGKIKGVGINTFQYLRMMGGIDTVMPDKIVKRVINQILKEADEKPVENDIAFIETVHRVAEITGYRAIELCWMTWLIQSEMGVERIEKYADILPKI